MSGTPWAPVDFGDQIPGTDNLTSAGTTQATAFQLTTKISIFTTVGAGSGAMLPGSFASRIELKVLNRGANGLRVYPAPGDQIETYGTNSYVIVAPSGVAYFTYIGQPTQQPRTWRLS